ncbi:MAG: glycerophosphodiester phosphodiesterase, partial [Nocardioidaceae bacterium]
VQSFDHEAMRSFKDLLPAVPVGLLGTPPRRRLHRLAEWADQVNPRHRSVGRGYVDAVHAAGLDCQVWTVDEVADMRRALALGVDGIITNRPDVLGRLLRESVPAAA